MLLATHATAPVDAIFEVARRARAWRDEHGADGTVDATLGQLVREDGRLWVPDAMRRAAQALDPQEQGAYAPFLGTPGFRKAVARQVPVPAGLHATVLATPGATGALYLAVADYSRPGDALLVHTPCWPAYGTMVSDHARRIEPWPLLDASGRLHTEALATRAEAVRRVQGRVLIVLNAPAQNPAGFCPDDDDWTRFAEVLRDVADRGDPVVALVDASYLELAPEPERERAIVARLSGLPPSALVLVAWSASKAYGMYGWRTGALVAASPDSGAIQELEERAASTVRGAWGNPGRPGMAVVERIESDPVLALDLERERVAMRAALSERSAALDAAARLERLPWRAGFFTVVRHPEPWAAAARLEARGVFTVPLSEGLRVALAGVPLDRIERLGRALAAV